MNLKYFLNAVAVVAGLFLSVEVDAQLVELMLSPRTVDDRLIEPDDNGVYQLKVGEPFDLEVSYDDLRLFTDRLGAFQLRTDLSVNQPGILEPVLTETQQITIGAEVFQLPGNSTGTFTVRMENSANSYVSSFNDFATNSLGELSNALQSFGYQPNQYELTMPTIRTGGVGFQIRYLDDEFADVNLPNVFIETNFPIVIPVDFVEILPRNPDGSINNDAVVLNLNTRSRTFNDNENFYSSNNTGSFDPTNGFENLGGIGGIPSLGGGIPQLSDDGSFVTPFDAYSIRVKFLEPVTNFVVDLTPNADPEAVLLYGEDDVIPTELIRIDEDARLVFNVVPEPSSSLLGVLGMLVVLARRYRSRDVEPGPFLARSDDA